MDEDLETAANVREERKAYRLAIKKRMKVENNFKVTIKRNLFHECLHRFTTNASYNPNVLPVIEPPNKI